jgi:hypothetical protein
MHAMSGEHYCSLVWAGCFGIFVLDIIALVFVLMKVRKIGLRNLLVALCILLICVLPFLIFLLGCGLV